ncbi:cytochrome-c oxidase, cbb3-type subunit III [Sphingomonas sp. BN140010]|uniref:Cbb3-type cytochrome c oxidase subunit n=1 Tax=Sphingomonas arvum TaxID=2992113 RepID=A0ABT3JBI0_9SPHN|nr:cytochrome-c oxidase, cbb3-type subunit III [Sphingomonas sp. BN140010]MCW3796417.1 cytochrome-c oxidase, cbb3-type subunit III [Sphingomonas sp. BN140010]
MADDKKRIDHPTGTETVGHEWDGIEELNTPLPRWWLWTFYITIAWGLAYTIFYPAWPMIRSATAGTLGWSSQGQLEGELKAAEAQRAPVLRAIAATPAEHLTGNPQLFQAAVEGGRAAFRVNCVQCHGSGATGSKGYPNLNDDDWLWGGDMGAIHHTLVDGVRNPDHEATRMSLMPAFGRDGILQPDQIQSLVAYVRTISHQRKPDAMALQGRDLFAANCAACHGPDGKGNRQFGAPNLTDGIWLYGGDEATLTETITNSRAGVMPRWGEKLDPVTVKMLAAYVYSLGGGEAKKVQTASR